MFIDYLQKLSAFRNYDRLVTISDRMRSQRRAERALRAAEPDGLAETARLRAELTRALAGRVAPVPTADPDNDGAASGCG